ncbi:MAG TPA: hypothetical protein DDX71_00310 [Ruminococcus sp.]|nr:hypothetical protein [Ruminococcus sp.]
MKDEPLKLPKQSPRLLDHLLVHEGLSMSVKNKRKFPERLVRILISLCGTFGILWTLQGFFQFPVDPMPLCMFAVVLTFIMRGVRAMFPKMGFACILMAFAAIPFELLRHSEEAVVGTGAVYSIMRKRILWQAVFETSTANINGFSEADCVRFIGDMLVIAIVALLEYSDVLMTHAQSSRSGFWIRLLISFPFLECGLYFGLETYPAAVFLLIAFWIGTLAIARKHPSRREALAQGKSYRIQHSFSAEVENRFTTHESGALFLLLAVAVLSFGAIKATSGYVRSEKMLKARKDLRNFYSNFSVRDVTGLLQKIPSDLGVNVISDEVDLFRAADLNFSGKPVMHISTGGALPPADYYMRGIIRSEYTGRGWAIPNRIYRKQQNLFEQLASADRMPQMLYHSGHISDLRLEDGRLPVVQMDVHALQPESISFIPYQALIRTGSRFRYDIETELDSTKDYSFWVVTNALLDWDLFSDQTAPSQNELIAQYEQFVENTYLSVPETESMERVRADFSMYSPNPNTTLVKKLETIRNYIWSRAEYTMHPAPAPEDRDYVEYFLSEGGEGYCAHYASSAVLLCRMSGIPARYVQGYVIPKNSFPSSRLSETYEIDVPDYQAHAWAEIYVKGFGWIPYEFTESVAESWHIPHEPDTPVTLPGYTTTTTNVTTTAFSSTSDVSTSLSSTTKTTTTTASGGNVMHGDHGLTPQQRTVLHRTLLTIVLIALILCAWLGWHFMTVRRREMALSEDDPNRSADAAYAFLMHLLHIRHIDQENRSHEEFAALAEKECPLLEKGRITEAISIQQAVAFSRNGITQDDAKRIRGTALQLADEMYRNAGRLRRFWLRWFRHIVR